MKININKSGLIKTFALLIAVAGININFLEASEKRVAVITKIHRVVEIKKTNSDEWFLAAVGDYLSRGDRIKAHRRSSAEIAFLSGIDITLEENTKIEIKETGVSEEGTGIEMFKGEIFNRVRGLTSLEIRTPQAVAAVRGTKFGVSLDQFTRVYVLEGVVDVYNEQGKVELAEGRETTVESGKAPQQPREISRQDRREMDREASKSSLKLTFIDEPVAAHPVKVRIEALNEEGAVDKDVRERVNITAGPETYISQDVGGLKWESLPGTVRLENGEKEFYMKTFSEGIRAVSLSSRDLISEAAEINFTLPEEKELILDLDNDYKLRLKFKKQ